MFTRKGTPETGPSDQPIPSVQPPPVHTRVPPLQQSVPEARQAPPLPVADAAEEGLVVVGRGTRISGRIDDCRKLVVLGVVEADVVAERLVVREGGGIKGTVQVDDAEIHGVLEGTLLVHEHLAIHSTAHITGDVGYRTLAIAAGARLDGSISCNAPEAPETAAAAPDNVIPLN